MAQDRTVYFKEYRSKPKIKEKQRQHQKNWRNGNPKRAAQIKKKYRKDNGGLQVENKWTIVKRRLERVRLADNYLRYNLKRHMEGVVKNIPPEMIEIYRKLLLTKRLLKIKKHGSNNKRQLLSGYEKSTQRELSRIINGQKKTLNRKGGK